MREAMNGSGKSYAKRKPGQYPKGGGKGLQGDALKGNVSQSTINDIKRMGMTAALKLAGENGKTAGGLAREFQEGVRRMYGADRLAAAKAKYAPAPTKKPVAGTKNKPVMVDGKGPNAIKPSTRTSSSPKPTAQQMAQAKARAGGNPNLKVTPKATPTESPAQKAAKAALAKKRREASAAAIKRAGGRTM